MAVTVLKTIVSTPLDCFLYSAEQKDVIREIAEIQLGVALGEGDDEYGWQIENVETENTGVPGDFCLKFHITAERNDPF